MRVTPRVEMVNNTSEALSTLLFAKSFGYTQVSFTSYLFQLYSLTGSLDGVVVRALASHQCGPGSITRHHMWVEFVGSLSTCTAPRGFSLGTYFIFPLSLQKTPNL